MGEGGGVSRIGGRGSDDEVDIQTEVIVGELDKSR